MAEADYPLLVFPEPTVAEWARRPGFSSKINRPGATRQAQRLMPQFRRLQQVMEGRRMALQDSPTGIQPELVLVLETIGSVDSFVNSVHHVQGLEWLGEYELDGICPEYGFEDKQSPNKHLRGQLFLVMTNQRALQELNSLFQRWKDDPQKKFPYGLAPLRRAFEHLYSLRPWGLEDRVQETGILEDWNDRLRHEGSESVPFEAELWFRQEHARRDQSESLLRDVIESSGGQVVQQCVVPEIAYHGVLGRMPRAAVQSIMADVQEYREIRLFKCEDIFRVRPVGQCTIRMSDDRETEPLTDEEVAELIPHAVQPEDNPFVALFDGLPMTGHRLLDNRLIVDDPDGCEAHYPSSARVHGTGMASLICHGDLNRPGDPLDGPLYVRPILRPRQSFEGTFEEAIPEDVLVVDLIHRAVRRLFEPEDGQLPAAPSVRIINLSVCDYARPLIREMSAWARLLDWLAWKYHVLFVVSAGNHTQRLQLRVTRSDLRLHPDRLEGAVIRAVVEDTRNRRLLSPAETLNGITVGAAHDDASSPPPSTHPPVDPFVAPGLPSLISAHGPGYRRAIKPEVFLPGGRQLLLVDPGNAHAPVIVRPSIVARPGQRVATPGTAGGLDQTTYTRGTSNAAAVASRVAGSLYRLVGQLRGPSGLALPPDYSDYAVVLTKALLVHGAEWGCAGKHFEAALKNAENSRTFKEYVGRFLGYGTSDVAKVVNCTEQRVTVLGYGRLTDREGAEFTFPFPPSLSAVNEHRRLTITLAWLSPVNSNRQGYRVAHLWFNPKNDIASNRVCADHRAVQRGTVQHEILEGRAAADFNDGDAMTLKVNCRADTSYISDPIRFGLAVTLEVAENTGISIYHEIRDRLAVRIPVQPA